MSRSIVPAVLRYVDQVAKSGSIQAAARELNVAASAVDRQILRLEQDLGVPIFERLPRGMRLTASGEAVVGMARRWRGDSRHMVAEVFRLQGMQQGQVHIWAMDSHASSFLPRMVDRLCVEHPRISLAIEVAGTDAAASALLSGLADLVIAFNLPPRREFNVLWRLELPFGCVVAPGHPLAGESSLHLRQLAGQNVVLQSRSLAIRSFLDLHYNWVLAEASNRVETNSLQLLKGLACSGRYVAFTSELDAANELAEGALRFLQVRDQGAMPQNVAIAADASKPVASIVRIVAEAAADAIETRIEAARAGQATGLHSNSGNAASENL